MIECDYCSRGATFQVHYKSASMSACGHHLTRAINTWTSSGVTVIVRGIGGFEEPSRLSPAELIKRTLEHWAID